VYLNQKDPAGQTKGSGQKHVSKTRRYSDVYLLVFFRWKSEMSQ